MASSFDLKSEGMRDEQMHGVWSMFEQLSSDFRAILRDLDIDLRRAASLGGSDLKKSDVLPHNRLALPRSAASVHGVGHEGVCAVAAVARYCTHETASTGSKAPQNGR